MRLLLSFATPLGLWWGIILLPLALLFLLRQRRKLARVGSTYLWRRVVEDRRASSPLKRPSNWLSLLLLLLATSALVLSLAGLRYGKGKGAGRAMILVIDHSASMGTRVEGEGRTRLDEARDAALRALEGLDANDPVTLIAAGQQPRPWLRASLDHALARHHIETLRLQAAAGDLRAALDLALMERESQGGSAEIILLSDCALDPEVLKLIADSPLRLLRCGAPSPGVGIIGATASMTGNQTLLLVTVAARGTRTQTRVLSLEREGQLVDAREITLDGGESKALAFTVPPPSTNAPEALRLVLDPEDSFPLDDSIDVGLARRAPPRILLVGPAHPFLDGLASVFPAASVERVDANQVAQWTPAAPGPIDLAIVSEAPDQEIVWPTRVARELWLGCLPKSAISSKGRLLQPPLLDWERNSESLRGIGFENLLIFESLHLIAPPNSRVLMRVRGGPQLLRLPIGERSLLVWASRLDDSNLAVLPAMPLLLRNLMAKALSGVLCDLQAAGRPLRLEKGLGTLNGRCQLEIKGPDGTRQRSVGDAGETYLWPGSPPLGLYDLHSRELDGEAEAHRLLGTGLLCPKESLRPVLGAKKSQGQLRGEPASEFSVERPAWHFLVALGALLLYIEAAVGLKPRPPPRPKMR